MKERKKMTGFVQDTNVPEIVNRKCQEAYDIIYRECRQKNRNITMKICSDENNPEEEVYRNCEHIEGKINIKKIISVASCAAVLAAGLLIPITWSGLPTLKNSISNSEPKSAISNSEQESTLSSSEPENELNIPKPESAFAFMAQKVYAKESRYKNDLTPYADPVYKTSSGENGIAEVTLQSVYCDSFNLAIALSITLKDEELFKKTTGMEVCCDVLLNGTPLVENPEYKTLGFISGGDGNYYETLDFPMLDIKEGAELEIKISNLSGYNTYNQIGQIDDADGLFVYNPENTVVIKDEYNFVHTIKVDTSHNKLYKVNETYDDIELAEIMVTPFMTGIEITQSETHSIRLFDQNSDEMDVIVVGEDGKWCFSSPYKTSEILLVEVDSFGADEFTIEHTFEVPIDEGFSENYTVDYNDSITFIDESKVVYDPPMEEMEAKSQNFQEELYEKMRANVIPEPVGTTVTYYENDVLSWTITGYEVADASDYEIDNDWALKEYENMYGSTDGAKLMLITCEIENTGDYIIVEACIPGLYLVSKDCYNLPEYFTSFNEYHYVSYKDNYGKSSYMYNFEPHEKKTITFGYVVPQECIDAGYWAIFFDKNASGDIYSDVINGKSKLCEIN